MSKTAECMAKAAVALGKPFRFLDTNRSVLLIGKGPTQKLILNTNIGILTDAEWKLYRDKYYTYLVYGKERFFPKTASFIDPEATTHYSPYITLKSLEQILGSVKKDFCFPMVIKRNSGTQGQNVFICQNETQALSAFAAIYSKKQLAYDHVALVCEYVKPKSEYRVVVYRNKLQFVYIKPHHRIEYGGAISPKLVTEQRIINSATRMVSDLCKYMPINYAGIDVIESFEGRFKVVEINGSPTYSSFINENGDAMVTDLFRRMLSDFGMQ